MLLKWYHCSLPLSAITKGSEANRPKIAASKQMHCWQRQLCPHQKPFAHGKHAKMFSTDGFPREKVQTWYFCNTLLHQEKSSWPLGQQPPPLGTTQSLAFPASSPQCYRPEWTKIKTGKKSSGNMGTKCLCSSLTKGAVIGKNNGSF